MSAGKRGWYVTTHCGVEYTVAESAAKAINNIRFRIGWNGRTDSWTAKEAT
jgi:hypothetical protein